MPYSASALGVGLRLRSRRVRSDRSQPSTTFRLALIAAVFAAIVGFLGSSLRADGDVDTPVVDAPSVAVSVTPAGSAAREAAASVRRAIRDNPTDTSALAATAPLAGVSAFVAAGGRSDALDTAPSLPLLSLGLEEQRYTDDLWAIHTQLELTSARVGLGAAFYRSQEIDRGELRARLTQGLARYRLAEVQVEALQPPPTLQATREGYLVVVRLFQQSTLEMLRMYEDGDDEHLSSALPMTLDGTNRLREMGARFWPESYPS
jgi:hypothetical protein